MSTELALPLPSPTDSRKLSPNDALSANETKIAAAVAILMGMFWAGTELAAIRREQSKAWLDDLAEFPAEIVEAACRAWRRDQRKKPAIADIRALCAERLPRPATTTEWQPAAKPITPAEKRLRDEREKLYADAAIARDAWAAAHGYRNYAEVIALGSGNFRNMILPLDSTETSARASLDEVDPL